MPTATSFFDKVDSQDLDGLGALCADDVTMVFANQEPLIGRAAVLAGNTGFYSSIKGLSHHIRNEWTFGATSIAETDVTYSRLDGKQVTLPATTIWDVDDTGLISQIRIFVDLAPVFAT